MDMVSLNLRELTQLLGPMSTARVALAWWAVLHRWTTSDLAPVESS